MIFGWLFLAFMLGATVSAAALRYMTWIIAEYDEVWDSFRDAIRQPRKQVH